MWRWAAGGIRVVAGARTSRALREGRASLPRVGDPPAWIRSLRPNAWRVGAGILGLAALAGLLAAPAGADELADHEAIDAICFEWGRAMGAEISRARLDPDIDAGKAAGIAAAAYARSSGADKKRALKLAAPANAFAIEIYKLTPRKPETMGVYAYFVCQIHNLTDRGLPSDPQRLGRIDALLGRCEAESPDDPALLHCVGEGIDALVPTFPPREDQARQQAPASPGTRARSGAVAAPDPSGADAGAP